MVFNKRNEWWIGCGMGFFILGVTFSFSWTALFHAKIKDMMILKNGSTSFSIWREIPIPIYLECFLFNITNVDDILDGKNVSIHVQEFGPYVFRERSTKVNITWNDNSTVTFKNQRFWYFEPELSNGSLSDMITTINPIIATIAYTMRKDNLMLRLIVDMVLRMYHTNMFVTANASSWLFDGVRDPVLDLAGQIPNLPYTIPFDRFGWFYSRNGSIDFDGLFEINTGETDFSQLGNIQNWQNSNRTVYREHCGDVKGSAGELWALNENGPHSEINIFAADLCTSMSLAYTGPVVKKGLQGVEFRANDSLFDNGHHYPDMGCYCSEVRDDECMPAGVFNVSACKYGAPAFVTKPHFLHMDPYYASKIEGLTPNEKHNFQMSIEPVTGMPLAVSAQLQANALVRHVPGIKINNQLPDPDVLVPMFWFREEIEVNDEYANFAKAALLVRFGFPYIFYSFIVIGLSLTIYGAYRLRRFAMLKIQKTDIAASQKFLGNEKYKNDFALSSTVYKK